MAIYVLAALATGGLGVSGLEPACGLPYPTLGPPVCTINEGDPNAAVYARVSVYPRS